MRNRPRDRPREMGSEVRSKWLMEPLTPHINIHIDTLLHTYARAVKMNLFSDAMQKAFITTINYHDLLHMHESSINEWPFRVVRFVFKSRLQ